MTERKRLNPEEEFKFAPMPGGGSDLETIETLAGAGIRISVESSSAINELYRKYGNKEELEQNFREEIGDIDEEVLEEVRSLVRNAAKRSGGSFMETSDFVVDNNGEGGGLRAYVWPFVAVTGYPDTGYDQDIAKEIIRERLRSEKLDERRMSEIDLYPGRKEINRKTVVVYTGKE